MMNEEFFDLCALVDNIEQMDDWARMAEYEECEDDWE